MDAPDTHDQIAVLLGTHNGGRFLSAQLESIAAQTHTAWRVWASDDASQDNTRDVLQRFQAAWGSQRLEILAGPASGFTANFLSLVCNPTIQADYFAYADQDDIWDADKFARALRWVKTVPGDVPALYFSRTRLIDEDGRDIGLAPLFTRPPAFANALVQSIGGGNTMVFNKAARALLLEAGVASVPVSHDWWTYQLISGCGGQVFYDPAPTMRYRQHGRQVVGSNVGPAARLLRARQVFGGRFKAWNDANIRALYPVRHRLTPANQQTFDLLCAARAGSWPQRLRALKKSGIHRQGFVDNVGLYVAVALNRF
jgi:glycosyltransferase involved in cell wall biosynthesis